MYCILGMIQSTILYFGLVSVIKASSFEAFLLYLAAVLVHAVFCKLTKDDRSTGEIVFSILGHDTIAPFLGVKRLPNFFYASMFSTGTNLTPLFFCPKILPRQYGELFSRYTL